MKIRISTMIAVATALLALPAYAGVSGNYYEDFDQQTCGAGSCTLVFPAFPASIHGKYVTITEVSCSITINEVLGYAALSVGGRRTHYLSVPAHSGNLSFRDPANFKVAANSGNVLWLTFAGNAAAPMTASCAVVGTITPN